MKVRILRFIKLLAVMILVFMLLSGFAASGDDWDYQQMRDLLTKRTEIVQKFMFRNDTDLYDTFSSLSDIETYPLLSEDWENLKACLDSEYDKIINIHVSDVQRSSKEGSVIFYYVKIIWYMAGDDGHYTIISDYNVKACLINKKLKLISILKK